MVIEKEQPTWNIFRDIPHSNGGRGNTEEEEEEEGGVKGIEQKHKEMASLEVETFTVTFSEAGRMYE